MNNFMPKTALQRQLALEEEAAYKETHMAPGERRFRKVLGLAKKGLVTEEEAWYETCEIIAEMYAARDDSLSDAERFAKAGIEVRKWEPPNENGCSNCTWHAYDAQDNNLDGGSISMMIQGHIEDWGNYPGRVAYVRPVLRGREAVLARRHDDREEWLRLKAASGLD